MRRHWPWLEEFMHQHKLSINGAEFTRHSLMMRDLYIKFLYHTYVRSIFFIKTFRVGQRTPITGDFAQKMLKFGTETADDRAIDSTNGTSTAIVSSLPPESLVSNPSQNFPPTSSKANLPPKSKFHQNSDDFLRLAKWKINDLSFLVGSDLAIFGTKLHPCISLRLSPLHEPINVLTGIDMWLENILNEVPEVAMCFHNEGIVMQEYELYKTADLPKLAGFQKDHVIRILNNLVMFFKNNATQEGHTYWLVKEAGFDVVKLYDLTVLCEKSEMPVVEGQVEETDSGDWNSNGVNPFILPVATLCFKLAEHRVRQRDLYLKRQASIGVSNPQKVDSPQDDMDNYVKDLRSFLTDVLRLLKNCLNLITTIENGEGDVFEWEQPLPGSRSTSPSRPPPIKPYADLKSRALLLLCRLYLSTPPEDIIACASSVLKPTPPGPEASVISTIQVVSVNVAEFASEAGVSADSTDAVYPPVSDSAKSPSSARRQATTTSLLGDSIIEAFRSPQTDRVSILAMTLAETVHPMLPGVGVNIDVGDPITSADFWGTQPIGAPRGGRLEIVPGGEERWVHRRKVAGEMLPLLLAKYALTRASRLWARVFGSGASPASLNQTSAFRLYECARLSLMSLVLFEHLAADEAREGKEPSTEPVCRFCHRASQVSRHPHSEYLVRQLPMAARRLYVLVIHGLNDARKLGAQLSIPSPNSARYNSEDPNNVLMRPTLEHICPEGSRFMSPVLQAVVLGPTHHEHVCSETESCDFSDPRGCVLTCWLSALDLAAHCLHRLLPLTLTSTDSPSSTMASFGLLQDFTAQLPITKVPQYLPLTLNDYMFALRRYLEHFPSMESLIKVAIVKMPDLIRPPQEYTEVNGHVLPPVLPLLRLAIDALAPGFTAFSVDQCSQADLGLLSSMTNDVLRTATEYSAIGNIEFYRSEVPQLWLLDHIASVLRAVQKLVPFQLNSLLTTDLLEPGGTSTRRKSAAGDICYRLLNEGYLSPKAIRGIIFFRLHVVKNAILLMQYSEATSCPESTVRQDRTTHSSSLLGQMRVSLAWLNKHLAICCSHQSNTAEAFDGVDVTEDSLLFVSVVTSIVQLQSAHIVVLSEAGITQVLRDAVASLPVIRILCNWLSSADGERKRECENDTRVELAYTLFQLATSLDSLFAGLYTKVLDGVLGRKGRSRRKRGGNSTVGNDSDSSNNKLELLAKLIRSVSLHRNKEEMCNRHTSIDAESWANCVQIQLIAVEQYLCPR
ncbi:unnamed protein product [Mesocestoides corti]|uniref:EDRF1 N-terminal domain-containing protein n=1 Tax=Mesocestoides corti TaxID=53468 RepID=A0A0R3UNV3_MESCO|nr:unnamed protein product [Mesocestoides corti]